MDLQFTYTFLNIRVNSTFSR